jgi:hypothetical protein
LDKKTRARVPAGTQTQAARRSTGGTVLIMDKAEKIERIVFLLALIVIALDLLFWRP